MMNPLTLTSHAVQVIPPVQAATLAPHQLYHHFTTTLPFHPQPYRSAIATISKIAFVEGGDNKMKASNSIELNLAPSKVLLIFFSSTTLLVSTMTGTTPTSSSSSSSFHPAFAVNNIKNFIPLVLDQEDDQYASWVELFHIHACAYNVIDHINTKGSKSSSVDDPTWERLDAIVKQWIYGTILKDLLQTIMKPGASARELWVRLEEIFQDNKHTRAVYLEEQFNTIRLENFSNMSDYCKRVKHLADQLANVGNPISEDGEYDTIATMIQQADPLPSFNKARSQLLLEETRRSKQESHTQHALVTSQQSTQQQPTMQGRNTTVINRGAEI
ncbi:hypothetical protein OSB04_030631 [Centaurea solstitialis]|uniref:Uncharacterized protein n=1 Tax=Centaurea solstitialis TaxID=347529 RepID=A0AA38S8U8_9ASTR|nr:hypothetical protein OSB04_030631 [Centaurea solstitialis]